MTGKIQASSLSVGTMVSLVVAVLAGGMFIGGMEGDINLLKSAVAEDNVRERKDLEQDQEDRERLIKIETNVDNMKEDIEEAKEIAKDNAKILDQILRKLDD